MSIKMQPILKYQINETFLLLQKRLSILISKGLEDNLGFKINRFGYN